MKKYLEWLVVFLILVIFIAYVILNSTSDTLRFDLLLDYKGLIIKGYFNTILFSLISFFLSIVFGIILFLMSESNNGILNKFSTLITEIAMGTPLLVLIIISVYFIADSFGFENKVFIVVCAMTLYSGPYIRNILNGAVHSINKDQFILMDLYNFNKFEKYVYIIFPQIVKQVTPSTLGVFSMIVKGTALFNVVAVPELFYQIKTFQSKTFAFTEAYIVMWVLYLSITIPLSILTKAMEKRFSYEN